MWTIAATALVLGIVIGVMLHRWLVAHSGVRVKVGFCGFDLSLTKVSTEYKCSQCGAGMSMGEPIGLLADHLLCVSCIEKLGKCLDCGWPLAKSEAEGCVIGNCSQRPKPKVRR